jgi:hypothetical protein
MRWAQFVASPGRLHCWIAPPQRQHRPLIRRFHTRCLNRPRRPFHREVRGRCSGQEFIEPFEEHDRPEGLRVSKRRRPCHRRTLRCPRICAVSRTGRIAPLNLSGLTAAQNVAIGPKRHFAATQHLVASLIGRLGSSAFRLSTSSVSMSLTGSCFSSESAPRPFHHGSRGRGGTIFRAALPSHERQVQATKRTHLIHRPARDIFPPQGGTRVSSYRV